jgi:hypothetical protein
VGNETKDLLRAAFSIGGSPKGVGWIPMLVKGTFL